MATPKRPRAGFSAWAGRRGAGRAACRAPAVGLGGRLERLVGGWSRLGRPPGAARASPSWARAGARAGRAARPRASRPRCAPAKSPGAAGGPPAVEEGPAAERQQEEEGGDQAEQHRQLEQLQHGRKVFRPRRPGQFPSGPAAAPHASHGASPATVSTTVTAPAARSSASEPEAPGDPHQPDPGGPGRPHVGRAVADEDGVGRPGAEPPHDLRACRPGRACGAPRRRR